MKNGAKILLTTFAMTLMLSMTAMAGQWERDTTGWWYRNDDGSYYAGCWQWIDGNGDGVAECYYFNQEGYLIVDGIADGYAVNTDGAWIENGVVQRKVTVDPSNDSAAVAIYMAAQEKHTALDSLEADTSYIMDMEMQGISMEMGMDMEMKMTGIRSGNLQYVMSGTMEMLGTEMPVTAFYKDGWYYMDMLDMKMKQPMDYAAAIETLNDSTGAAEVSVAMMRNMKVSQDGENTVLTYNVSESVLNSYMETALAQTSGAGTSIVSYRINAANGSATIDKNGYYAQEKVIMDMEMSVYDPKTDTSSKARYTVDMTSNYKNMGQPVTITFPSTDGYTDITAQ